MIRAYQWSPATRTMAPLTREALPARAADVPEGEVLWLDLQDATIEEEEFALKQFLPVHALTMEDLTRTRRVPEQGAHLPKVEEFDEYLLVIVNPLPWNVCDPKSEEARNLSTKVKRPQLSALLTQNVLITHHYEPLPCVEDLHRHLTHRGDVANRGPDYLFHVILDAMVDEYAPVVERFGGSLLRLESRLFEQPSKELLTKLIRLKRRVIYLRKTMILEREVLARLVRAEFSLVTEQELHYYRNVYDHLVRYSELIEGAREMVSDLLELHLVATSNKLNEIMKVLTMISTVILPLTLIVGYYGMNFKHMDELDWEHGHWWVLGLMGMVVAAAGVLFRWKRWL